MRPLGASVYFLFEIVLTRNIKHSVFCLQEIDDRCLVTIWALAENALSDSTLVGFTFLMYSYDRRSCVPRVPSASKIAISRRTPIRASFEEELRPLVSLHIFRHCLVA
jgi:hypothetical protein